MRNAILVSILTVGLVVGSVSVHAGPPVNGTWKSSSGHFDEGREGSAWTGGGFLSAGNVLHAESWDGAALGGDWKVLCPVVTNVTLIVDLVFGGNGQRIYLIEYAGGTVQLDGSGPWGGGDAVYTGVIDTYYETRTLQFIANNMVASVSDHAVSAKLQGYNTKCMTWGVGNGVWRGNGTRSSPNPAYLNATCNTVFPNGHYGDVRDLTIVVQGCAVPTEQSTWGAVKALYRE